MATTLDDVATALAGHDSSVKAQIEQLVQVIKTIKDTSGAEGTNMTTDNTANAILMALLSGANGNTLGHGRNWTDGVQEGYVTTTQLQTGLNHVTSAAESTAIMEGVADIKTAIPLAEGQIQLALAGAVADLNRNIDNTGDQITAQLNAAQLANAQQFSAASRQVQDVMAATLASQNNINVNVLQTAAQTREAINLNGAASLLATERAATATALAVANSTKEILGAINSQNLDELRRQLTVAETNLMNERFQGRSRETEINISNTNTATAQQFQMQNQQQQQFQLLAQLTANMNNLASDIQSVKQGSVVFNSGRMQESGNQSAANTRVSG